MLIFSGAGYKRSVIFIVIFDVLVELVFVEPSYKQVLFKLLKLYKLSHIRHV